MNLEKQELSFLVASGVILLIGLASFLAGYLCGLPNAN
jgi:hypothetical protein